MTERQFLHRPSKDAIRELPPFPGLPLERIHLIRDEADAQRAREQILAADAVGFDTESKPTFFAGQEHTGPHLVQIATRERAFLFTVDTGAGGAVLREVIATETVLKVGFGLRSDRGPIQRKLEVALEPVIELCKATQALGYKHQVGLQAAVAIVLGQYLQKSKKVTTSNWAARELSPAQQRYAANDAYASLLVYLELARSAPQVLLPG